MNINKLADKLAKEKVENIDIFISSIMKQYPNATTDDFHLEITKSFSNGYAQEIYNLKYIPNKNNCKQNTCDKCKFARKHPKNFEKYGIYYCDIEILPNTDSGIIQTTKEFGCIYFEGKA